MQRIQEFHSSRICKTAGRCRKTNAEFSCKLVSALNGLNYRPRYSPLLKQPTLRDATTGILMTRHYLDLGSAPDWLKQTSQIPSGTTNQKHYPVLDGDTSSVWNFCTCFSDVFSRRNQWWCLFSQARLGTELKPVFSP